MIGDGAEYLRLGLGVECHPVASQYFEVVSAGPHGRAGEIAREPAALVAEYRRGFDASGWQRSPAFDELEMSFDELEMCCVDRRAHPRQLLGWQL